jgi:hypothetical protein
MWKLCIPFFYDDKHIAGRYITIPNISTWCVLKWVGSIDAEQIMDWTDIIWRIKTKNILAMPYYIYAVQEDVN